jgi:hypothetical protein
MKRLAIYQLEIINAGRIGEIKDSLVALSDYFIIITFHKPTQSFAVFAEPDHNRVVRRLMRLKDVIDPRNFADVVDILQRSHLPINNPHLRSHKMTGLSAAFYAHQVTICASLNEELARDERLSEINFDAAGPPN